MSESYEAAIEIREALLHVRNAVVDVSNQVAMLSCDQEPSRDLALASEECVELRAALAQVRIDLDEAKALGRDLSRQVAWLRDLVAPGQALPPWEG